MTQVFISYSRKDIEFVERLVGDLQSAGFTAWYDLSGLEGGTQWGTEIQNAIENSQYFLVVVSPNSLNSKWMQREFLFAESCDLKVIPLQYLPCRLPMWLLDLQLIDLQGRNYDSNFERLLKALGWQPKAAEPQDQAKMDAESKDREFQQEKERKNKDEEQRRKLGIKAKKEGEAAERQARQEQQARAKAEEQGHRQAEKEQRRAANRSRRADAWQKWKPRLPRLAGLGVLGILLIAAAILAPGILGRMQANPQPTSSPAYGTASTSTHPTAVNTLEATVPTLTPATAATFTPALAIGSTWIRPADGMEMVYVPEGNFMMGAPDDIGLDSEHPQHTVNLDAFWMDQTEVTNAMVAACVQAGICKPPSSSYTFYTNKFVKFDWQSTIEGYMDYYGIIEYMNYPVIYVSWYDARKYCEWAGARLPTEAEWEKAARGTDGRASPWGSVFGERFYGIIGNFSHGCCCFDCVDHPTDVDSFPSGASSYGALNMVGNVWEWVNDWYSSTYYSQSPENNPTGPSSGDSRVMRGSSWFREGVLFSIPRAGEDPAKTSTDIGFRCARSSP